MPSFEHKRLVERIKLLDELPQNDAEYANWVKADGHLDLLHENAKADELIIYGSGEYTFIHTVVVSKNNISSFGQDDLLRWSGNPTQPFASYTSGGREYDGWIERSDHPSDSKTLQRAWQLVFSRNLDGLKEKNSRYYEILQEYAHLENIHWRQEQSAYCRFDENGDFEHIVSITSKEDEKSPRLVSFKREPLERYLAASNAVLIRMFDFTLLKLGNFNGWPEGDEKKIIESDSFFYWQKVIDGFAGYARGVQIIRPSRSKPQIFSRFSGHWSGHEESEHVEFIAHDWRNKRITKISTDPAATTNYFDAQGNSLPFELSPAFFKPEVLQKYKANSDKYKVSERNIYCRGAWMLRSYDVNEAGQVHAYICYLRSLPYQEQRYWLSFNEEPKANISERAFRSDFKGEIADLSPLQDILFILRRWKKSDCAWWKLREEALFERVHIPRTDSRDEWANAFGLLANLAIEGFQVKTIRARLEKTNIAFDKDDKSLALLEKFLIGHDKLNNDQRLEGLRIIQLIRNIGSSAHPRGNTASDLANNALQEHSTFSAHFESVCKTVKSELELIEEALS